MSVVRCVQPLALVFVGAVMGVLCAIIWASHGLVEQIT